MSLSYRWPFGFFSSCAYAWMHMRMAMGEIDSWELLWGQITADPELTPLMRPYTPPTYRQKHTVYNYGKKFFLSDKTLKHNKNVVSDHD